MSKVLKVENSDYLIAVQPGGSVIIDTARGTTDGGKPAGTVTIRGSLEVEGTTTTVESNDTLINDNVITLNNGQSGSGISASKGYISGIEIDRGSYSVAKFVFDEQINWTLGGDSGAGTFSFRQDANIIPINTNGIVAQGTLFVDTGNSVISVTNTTDYEEGIFTYAGGVITDGGSGVIIDDDNIPNTKAVADYVNFILGSAFQDRIEENDTFVETKDFDTTGNESVVDIGIDNTVTASFYNNRIDLQDIEIKGSSITTTSSNSTLTLSAPGTGYVKIQDVLELTETPGDDDLTTIDPAAPAEGLRLYSKTEDTGGTGLYFVNKSTTQDELISNNRALLYGMLF